MDEPGSPSKRKTASTRGNGGTSGSSVLVWILTGLTFAFALFAVVDQASLRRSLGVRVFDVDGNGTARLSDGVQRVILGPEAPEDGIYSIPTHTMYKPLFAKSMVS